MLSRTEKHPEHFWNSWFCARAVSSIFCSKPISPHSHLGALYKHTEIFSKYLPVQQRKNKAKQGFAWLEIEPRAASRAQCPRFKAGSPKIKIKNSKGESLSERLSSFCSRFVHCAPTHTPQTPWKSTELVRADVSSVLQNHPGGEGSGILPASLSPTQE